MEIREKIAEALMKAHGFEKGPDQSLEWDAESNESQYSMALGDADIALEAIMALDTEPEPEPEPEPLLGVVAPPPTSSAVRTSAALFFFMETPEGVPTYVSDVRAWLVEVDQAGIPEDTEVEGALYLSYDTVTHGAEPVSCGECDHTEDIVLYTHSCR
jgi:hypothetical protein